MWVEFVVGSPMLREVFLRVLRFSPLRKKKITIYNFLMLVLMIMVTLIIIVMIMKVIITMVITVNNNNNNNNSNLGTVHILRKVLLAKCTLYYEGLWFCSQCLRKMADLR